MKHIAATLTLALTLVACSPPDPEIFQAEQAATVASPYGTAAVNVYAGWSADLNENVALYRRNSDRDCTVTNMGTTRVTGTWTLSASPSNDFMEIVIWPETAIGCSSGAAIQSLTAPVMGTSFSDTITLLGGDGNDTINVGGGTTGVGTATNANKGKGENGDDHIFVYGPGAQGIGGLGNDILWAATSSIGNQRLEGDSGQDCLQYQGNVPPQVYDCAGDNTLNSADRSTGVLGAHCQSIVSACF